MKLTFAHSPTNMENKKIITDEEIEALADSIDFGYSHTAIKRREGAIMGMKALCDHYHQSALPEVRDGVFDDKTIDTVGKCANCGVEIHIHKESDVRDEITNMKAIVAKQDELIKKLDQFLIDDDYPAEFLYPDIREQIASLRGEKKG